MKITQPIIAAAQAPAGLSNGDYGTSAGCTLQKKGTGSWDFELDSDVPDGSMIAVASLAGTAGGADPVVHVRVGYRPAGTQGTGGSIYTYTTAGPGTLTDAAISLIVTTIPSGT